MKMRAGICLLLALLVGCLPAMAGGTAGVVIDYAGVYVPFAGHNFQLYLPSDWLVSTPGGDVTFAAEDPAGDAQFLVAIVPAGGQYTLDGLLAEFEASDAYEAVAPLWIGGVPYIYYESPGEDAFGFLTLAADASFMYYFKFLPLEDTALHTLGLKIMASLEMTEE